MREFRIEIYGRVQGVLFRNMAKEFCDKRKITGHIRNRKDGSVLIVAQGIDGELKNLVAWLKSGPGLTRVVDLNCKELKVKKEFSDFEVIRKDNLLIDKSKAIINLGKYILKKEEAKIPLHIAIIPDGNRRWAREKGLKASMGHYKAGNYGNLETVFMEAKKLGVKFMSIWGFSTENWNRNPKEIKAVFNVVSKFLHKFRKDAHKNKIRFRHLGRRDRLPRALASELEKLEKETEKYDDFSVQLCLDYGGKDELVRAFNKILKSGKKKISEEDLLRHLDTHGIPDPDLVIRTSGELRLSGFMPLQAGYSELYSVDKYFPDFGPLDLRKAVEEYGKRIRRFGGTNEKDLGKN